MNQPDDSVLGRSFRALAASRRRVALARLLDTDDGVVTFDELVGGVVEAGAWSGRRTEQVVTYVELVPERDAVTTEE